MYSYRSRLACGLVGLLAGLFFCSAPALAQQGTVAGTLVDADTGDPLIGANVQVEGSATGAATDIDGAYRLKLDAGTYTLVYSYIGYNTTNVENVVVTAGAVTRLDVALTTEAVEVEGGEVVVEAAALLNSEAALLRERQKASGVSDAISAEAISRSGSSSAADAMEKVTGASVVGGKYVYVRGLGERYMNTQLNGASLPSADPDRNSVPLDLFPSEALDNIVTTKSFTPDKPGNFVGGNINITTRAFPESFRFSLSSSIGYNTQTTGSDEFLTYPGADIDFLGFDKPGLAVPSLWQARPADAPPLISVIARNDPALAAELDQLARSFSPVMAPVTDTAPFDRGFSASVGNQVRLFGRPLGFHGGVSYDEHHSFYDEGTYGEFKLTGPVAEKDELDQQVGLTDRRGTEEVLLGGLGTLSYKLTPTQIISGTYMYNRSAESVAQLQVGSLQRDLPGSSVFETRVLGYTERLLQSFQLSGEHLIAPLGDLRAGWTTSLTNTMQEEPDLRFFANQINIIDRATGIDTVYAIRTSNYTPPSRYFRDLEEDAWDSKLDLTLPVAKAGTLKAGGAFNTRERVFTEQLFIYELNPADARYAGDPSAFFGPMTGVIDTTYAADGSIRRLTIGNYIQDATTPSNNYTGDQQIYTAYGMVDLQLLKKLRLITGVRFEATRIDVASEDEDLPMGTIDENDFLPSLNLVYGFTDKMNLRAAYGRTLARPVFRELAPYSSFEFIGGRIFIGNPELERTLVDNYDLRWEWFSRPGEIVALSGFYKQFENPIELAIVSTNNQVQYQNVETAQVVGVEIEGRKRLDFLAPALANFEVGGNLSLVRSQVDIPEEELEEIRGLDPDADEQRALQGQSPYVLNLDLSYDNYKSGTMAGVFFNVFGRRLAEVSIGGTPDVYEEPVPMLDFVVSQEVGLGVRLKASAKNLLDPDVERTYRYKGTDFVAQSYQRGRSFSLSVTYSIK